MSSSSTLNSLSSSLPPSPSPSSSSTSTNLSLLIIFFLLISIIVITISIHLLLRFLFQQNPPAPTPTSITSTSTSITTSSNYNLPLFTLANLPFRPSADCAVCLSRFRHDDNLRLLPSCRHVFHSQCIDKWLKSTPSCPLCRSSIEPPLMPTATAVDDEATMGQWLKEYVDRMASAATSPFSSLRFLGCGSRRFDLEEGSVVSLEIGEESFRSSSESGYFASAYKWMAMARE